MTAITNHLSGVDNLPNVLEGIFAINKPAHISSADALQNLQNAFASSNLFTALRASQPSRPSKDPTTIFKIGHGGTLDPLASGILIIGIGRGTKHLSQFLACTKTYETVVVFGAATDTYDCTGKLTEVRDAGHVTKELVEEKLDSFRGKFRQVPPVYSALKVNGMKACEYVRQGKELPRELEGREVEVEECELLEWWEGGEYEYATPKFERDGHDGHDGDEGAEDQNLVEGAAARIRLTVSSGFYVRSFAHDLGIACQTRSHMAELVRTQQADFVLPEYTTTAESDLQPALTFAQLEAGEDVWGPILRTQLEKWIEQHPVGIGHVDGRNMMTKEKIREDKEGRPRQRFRGEWVADTKKERIRQQGGRWKGKWNQRKKEEAALDGG